MDLDRHDFQLEELMTRIKDGDHRLIALQVPEGLKMQALEMMDAIETDTSAKVVLAADPCYGACDLVHDKMQMMGVELVAHMGHSQMNIDSGQSYYFNVRSGESSEEHPNMKQVRATEKKQRALAEAAMGERLKRLQAYDEALREGQAAQLSGYAVQAAKVMRDAGALALPATSVKWVCR